MWTVREQMATDALDCIDRVAAAGYRAVELVGYGHAGFAAVRDGLGAAGVRAISQHLPYRRLAEELDTVIDEHVDLGGSDVVIQQGRGEDWVDADAVSAFAATCNAWGRACRDAGLALGYHGYHDLDAEFAPHGAGSRWDLFAAETDPELVFLQLDTFWVRRSGHDPVDVLDRFAGRVPSLHLKDTAVDDPGPIPSGTGAGLGDTTVGDGRMDLPAVLAAAARNGTRWVIVEQEGDPANAYRDIRRSRDNLAAVLEAAR